MTKHAKLSPSAAYRWMNCPGCIKAVEGASPPPPTSYAMIGSIAHELGEQCLLTGKNAEEYTGLKGWYAFDDTTGIAKTIPTGVTMRHILVIDEDMVDAVQSYVDTVVKTRSELQNAEFMVEEKLDISWLVPGMFGTGDHVAREPLGVIVVDDLKNGINIVEPNTPQLKIYGLGAIGEGNPYMAEEIIMRITQPNAPHPNGPVRYETMDIDDLLDWGYNILKPAADLVYKAISDFDNKKIGGVEWRQTYLVPGTWCKWCDVEGTCPANNMAQAKGMFGAPNLPAVVDSGGIPDVGLLQPEELFRIKDLLPQLESFIGAVKKACHQHITLNGPSFGYKLIQGLGNRKYIDERVARTTLSTFLSESEACIPLKLKSPAQIEKALVKRKIKPKDRQAILTPLVERPLGAKQLVLITHKSSALPASAEAMFGHPKK